MSKISQYPVVDSMGDSDYFLIDTYPITSSSTSIITKSNMLSGITGAVTSVFSRTGAVTAESGDYTASQVGALASSADLSSIASANATAGNVSMNSHKITNLTNGSGAQDAAAYGQIPTSASSIGGLLASNNLSDVGSASTSRSNLTAAKSGANSDITSLSGLTTALSIAQGGTGNTSANPAFNALSPMTTAGDTIYGGVSGAAARLAAGTSSQVLTGGTTPAWGAVVLSGSMVSGNLGVSHLNSGTSASSSTYWRGDGSWATPSGAGNVTGAASSTTGDMVQFADNTGQLLADNGISAPASNIVGITDTQNLSNKTITLTNGELLLAGSTSGTTILQASGTASGTVTVPATTDTLATLTGTETLQNKTLISPTLVTPALGVTTATSINGLSITSTTGALTLANAKTFTVNNSLTLAGTDSTTMTFPSSSDTVVTLAATQTLTNKPLTSPVINQFGTASGVGAAWGSWSPTFTNFTKGNATIVADYIQIGKVVFYTLSVTLGSTSTMGTAPTFSLPVNTEFSVANTNSYTLGTGGVTLAANDAVFFVRAQSAGSNTAVVTTENVSARSSYSQNAVFNEFGGITSTSPFTWTTGSCIDIEGFYWSV